MARLGFASLTGRSVASMSRASLQARGGSNPLGVKSVIFGTINKEGSVSSLFQSFRNPRGENLSNFLRSVKGSDGGATPLFPLQALSAKQTEAIRNTQVNAPAAEISKSQTTLSTENKPSDTWFGAPTPNQIPERAVDGQPKIADETIRFDQPKAESSQAKPASKDEANAAAELVRITEILPGEQFSLAERANLAILSRRARLVILRPSSQAIPMSGVGAEPLIDTRIKNEQRSINDTKQESAGQMPLRPETVKRTNQVKRNTRVVSKVLERVSPDIFRTRYVERDLEMNRQREQILINGFDEAEKETLDGEVSGSVISAKTLIGIRRDVRSQLLDQRDYKDREDGNQIRMDIFLRSLSAVKRNELKSIVKEYTALKDTYDPFEVASLDDVNNVVNPPKKIWGTRFEPVAVLEIIEQERVERGEVINSRKIEDAPIITDERLGTEAELNETKETQGESFGIWSRPLELMGNSINDFLNAGQVSLLQRRELVLN